MMMHLSQASLERIGVDSKGNVYWYDGGKNMFQSPPSNDPAYKPRYVGAHYFVLHDSACMYTCIHTCLKIALRCNIVYICVFILSVQ